MISVIPAIMGIMETTPQHPPDPVELVRHLDPDNIRAKLALMQRERSALLVLLRASLRARRPGSARTTDQKGGDHATA